MENGCSLSESESSGGKRLARLADMESGLTFARKKDANHDLIGNHLRSLGYSVLDIWRAGCGVPDLAVGMPGFAALVEVKMPERPKLTEDEQRVRDQWTGPYILATSPEQAAEELEAQRIAWKALAAMEGRF